LKKKFNTRSERTGKFTVVGPRGSGSEGRSTFRSSSSGEFVTRVMASDVFKAASEKANTAIEVALKHPPTVEWTKQKGGSARSPNSKGESYHAKKK
jgi:hypothetical protein